MPTEILKFYQKFSPKFVRNYGPNRSLGWINPPASTRMAIIHSGFNYYTYYTVCNKYWPVFRFDSGLPWNRSFLTEVEPIRSLIGTNEHERKAFEWYLKYAEAGNDSAQCNLGRCYLCEKEQVEMKKRPLSGILNLLEMKSYWNLGYCHEMELAQVRMKERSLSGI